MREMRHRLFHTLVLVGAALPIGACGGGDSGVASTDAGGDAPVDTAKGDGSQSETADTSGPGDSSDATDVTDGIAKDAADTGDGCEATGCGCMPCIK